MKLCSTCQKKKAHDEFNRRRKSKDGLSYVCKACGRTCDAANRKKNLEKYRAKGRAYAAKDRDGAKRRMKKWLSDPANIERKHQKDKEWRERNKERKAASDARWAQENPEKRKEIVKRYRDNNPETMRLRSYVQGARRRGTPSPSYETRDYILILEQDSCCYCGGPMEHLDHIDPLALLKDTEWPNLTASCRSCNLRKSAKHLLRLLWESLPRV